MLVGWGLCWWWKYTAQITLQENPLQGAQLAESLQFLWFPTMKFLLRLFRLVSPSQWLRMGDIRTQLLLSEAGHPSRPPLSGDSPLAWPRHFQNCRALWRLLTPASSLLLYFPSGSICIRFRRPSFPFPPPSSFIQASLLAGVGWGGDTLAFGSQRTQNNTGSNEKILEESSYIIRLQIHLYKRFVYKDVPDSCFENYVHVNHRGVMLKCRFWSSGSGRASKKLWGSKGCRSKDCILSSKVLECLYAPLSLSSLPWTVRGWLGGP